MMETSPIGRFPTFVTLDQVRGDEEREGRLSISPHVKRPAGDRRASGLWECAGRCDLASKAASSGPTRREDRNRPGEPQRATDRKSRVGGKGVAERGESGGRRFRKN